MWKAHPIAISVSAVGGIFQVHDGRERIAVAVEARAHQFFKHGIAVRRELLTGRYLRGIVPINPGAAVINFGANIGEVAVTLADRGAIVTAIEPDPNVIPALEANAIGRLVEVVPVAAWREDGELDMHIASDTADTSVFEPKAGRSTGRMTLPCRRIDTIVSERGLTRVHLLVGDAEGAEPEVLMGARETLQITDYVSLSGSDERCGQTTVDACEKILKDAGFDILHREDTKFCMLIAKRREISFAVA